MEETTSNKIVKQERSNNYMKKILIISLLPVPNFLILYYYIICFRIIIESYENECDTLDKYNITSLILIIIFNIYIVSQLCVDSPRLFFYQESKSNVFQLFLIIFLSVNILSGAYILKDEDTCKHIDENVYVLSVGNLILQSFIFIILIIYWFMVVCLFTDTQVKPHIASNEV